jgi:hypothetical protein
MPEHQPIVINIYTKSKESGKREAIFTNKDIPTGTKELVFDAPHLRKMFINYEIPGTEAALSGYILCMIGYKQ